jgi:anti-anti-sigma factor
MAIDEPLTIERKDGKTPETMIYTLSGPVTLRNLFDLQSQLRGSTPRPTVIIDMSGVPYMDSAGMGAIVNYYTHCRNKNSRLIMAGVSGRVMELFRMTKVDTIIHFEASVEEAEARLP